MMHTHYSAGWMHGLVAESRRMQAEGLSLRAAAKKLSVSHSHLSKWASHADVEDTVDELKKGHAVIF